MIRRAAWLTIGAVLGITGYRRVTRAARVLLPAPNLLTPLSRRAAGNGQARSAPRRRGAGVTAAFVRDVRAGMADYLDQQRDI
jgi:hypothetical protein